MARSASPTSKSESSNTASTEDDSPLFVREISVTHSKKRKHVDVLSKDEKQRDHKAPKPSSQVTALTSEAIYGDTAGDAGAPGQCAARESAISAVQALVNMDFEWHRDGESVIPTLLSNLQKILKTQDVPAKSCYIVRQCSHDLRLQMESFSDGTHVPMSGSGPVHAMALVARLASILLQIQKARIQQHESALEVCEATIAKLRSENESSQKRINELQDEVDRRVSFNDKERELWSKALQSLENDLSQCNPAKFKAKDDVINDLQQRLDNTADKARKERKAKTDARSDLFAAKGIERKLESEKQQQSKQLASKETQLQKTTARLDQIESEHKSEIQNQAQAFQEQMNGLRMECDAEIKLKDDLIIDLKAQVDTAREVIKKLQDSSDLRLLLYHQAEVESSELRRQQSLNTMAMNSALKQNKKEEERLRAWAADLSAKESQIKHGHVRCNANRYKGVIDESNAAAGDEDDQQLTHA